MAFSTADFIATTSTRYQATVPRAPSQLHYDHQIYRLRFNVRLKTKEKYISSYFTEREKKYLGLFNL